MRKWLRRALLLSSLLLLILSWFLGIIRWPKPRLGGTLTLAATVRHPEIDEGSGLIQSASHPERFWTHNDSGDYARIFAMTLDGEVLHPKGLTTEGPDPSYHGIAITNARLHDWEDITRHGDTLYIADMGNNLNRRRDLGVYEVPEPDPLKVQAARATAFYPVTYPDQTGFPPTDRWDFDCEAVFWANGKLYFVTKTRPALRVYVQGSSAGLYRLDSLHTDRDNVLTKVDRIDGLGGWVTAADVSADGRFLAILIESPVQSVWLYERPARGDKWFSQASSVRRYVFHDAGQIESLAFGHDEIVIVNEEQRIYRLSLNLFERVAEENPTSVQSSKR